MVGTMNPTKQIEQEMEEVFLENEIGYTEAELEEMARLDEMRSKYGRQPHEL
jgi:hypothetical protein